MSMPTGESAAKTGPLRLVLVSQRSLMAAGLLHILARQPTLTVLATAGCLDDAERLSLRHKPDATVLDDDMPGLDDPGSLLPFVRGGHRSVVVVLRAASSERSADEWLRRGARVVLPRTCTPTTLLRELVAVGDMGVRADEGRTRRRIIQRRLTSRQFAVLKLAARGLTNRQIAVSLRVSESTVKRHLYDASRVMLVSGRVNAINRARSLGYQL
jgi:DNA-binding NarL/FixJ family response regulator